jgi:hypothetical protein
MLKTCYPIEQGLRTGLDRQLHVSDKLHPRKETLLSITYMAHLELDLFWAL